MAFSVPKSATLFEEMFDFFFIVFYGERELPLKLRVATP